ncbi:hypothetical protein Tco_0760415, partial [Tanacetum coccineum]
MRYQTLTKNKGKTSSEVEPDIQTMELKTFSNVRAFLLSDDDLDQESDEEVFEAGEEMDDDPQAHDKEHPSPNTDASDSDSSSPDLLKKYDNILPHTERQLVKYLRKVCRVLFNKIFAYAWDKHTEATVSYADLRASI